jgi:hypothetical protein
MARTFRNSSYSQSRYSAPNRKSIQVRVNRVTRRNAKLALAAGLEIEVVRHQVDWIGH